MLLLMGALASLWRRMIAGAGRAVAKSEVSNGLHPPPGIEFPPRRAFTRHPISRYGPGRRVGTVQSFGREARV